MGEKVRDRTAQEQIIYDEVIERLMIGDKPGKLAEEYQLKSSTLRTWKAARKRQDASELAKRSNALTVYSEAKAAQAMMAIDSKGQKLSVASPVFERPETIPSVPGPHGTRNDTLGDDLKNVLLDQALVSKASLASLRCGVGGVLCQAHNSFRRLFERLDALIAAGGVYVADPFNDGPDVFEPLTLPELKTASSMLKELTKAFSDLHLLPHGAMRAAPVKFSDSIPPQHLHLHSHGGRRSSPTGLDTLLPAVVVEEEASTSDLHQEQDELLDLM